MRPNQIVDVLNQCKNDYFTQLWNSRIFLPGSCAMVIFPTSICFFQHFLWKKLHLCAHSRFASLCGFATVCLSSLVANFSIKNFYYFQNSAMYELLHEKNMIASSLLGVCQFFILARTFKVVLPSHLLHPGAYARKGIPLKLVQYLKPITKPQRRTIQQLGYSNGCHTCGKKYVKLINLGKRSFFYKFFPTHMKVDYIADHQPPKALVNFHNKKHILKGYLYPQCKSCSLTQASRVRLAKGSLEKDSHAIVTHGVRFKVWKLFFPWLLFVDADSIFNSITNFIYIVYSSWK